MDDEERRVMFLEWFDAECTAADARPEQIARKGGFDSSLISKYRKGKPVGQGTAEKAARGFGYDDEQVIALLQKLQFLPGGIYDDADTGRLAEVDKKSKSWLRQIVQIDDDEERGRLIDTVDLLVRQSVSRSKIRQKQGKTRDQGGQARNQSALTRAGNA